MRHFKPRFRLLAFQKLKYRYRYFQTLDDQLSQVLPKIELLEEFNADSEKMFTSLTNLFEELEEEQSEQKVKTMMNMLANMNSAQRIRQVEINSTPGMACILLTWNRSLV